MKHSVILSSVDLNKTALEESVLLPSSCFLGNTLQLLCGTIIGMKLVSVLAIKLVVY